MRCVLIPLVGTIFLLTMSTIDGAAPPQPPATVIDLLFAKFDKSKDSFLQRDEVPPMMRNVFARLDANGDGKLSRDELKPHESRLARFVPSEKSGEVNTPAAKGERHKDQLTVGDVAPDFSLPRVKEKGEVKLSSFKGKMPVVLIFASYT